MTLSGPGLGNPTLQGTQILSHLLLLKIQHHTPRNDPIFRRGLLRVRALRLARGRPRPG